MSTLIISRDPATSKERRCDARCYSAKGPKCKCVCGGINHAKGRNQAIDNTNQFLHPHSLTDEHPVIIFPSVNYHLFQEEKT